EVRQRISEPALTACEKCGGEVRRLLSATPFILKGGGWYVTDYPSESRKKAVESEKSAGKSADSGNGDKAGEKSGDKAADKSAAAGAKTSRPWKVGLTDGNRYSAARSSKAAQPCSARNGVNRPLSGPMKT